MFISVIQFKIFTDLCSFCVFVQLDVMWMEIVLYLGYKWLIITSLTRNRYRVSWNRYLLMSVFFSTTQTLFICCCMRMCFADFVCVCVCLFSYLQLIDQGQPWSDPLYKYMCVCSDFYTGSSDWSHGPSLVNLFVICNIIFRTNWISGFHQL